jgi:tetratricopeptide (TPR) repeat protein
MNMPRILHVALLALLAAWAAPGEAKWREASSRHFLIYSEQSESELREIADELERFDRALRVRLNRPDEDRSPATRLTIYVLANQVRLNEFLGRTDAAGIYMPRAGGSISFTHRERPRRGQESLDPKVVLFHEYTHHFMYNNFAFGAPLWFSEGYPEFWSTARKTPEGGISFGLTGTHRSTELTLLPKIGVSQLLSLRLPIRDSATYSAIYGRGWVLSHYLNFEPSRQGQLDAYLRKLHEGRTEAEAATAFGDLGRLDRELERYMVQRRFAYAVIPANLVAPGPIEVRELGAGEDAIMSVRMRSKRGVNAEQAQGLVSEARRIGERFPNDAAVQVALAEVEYDANNFAEAEAAADRAIAASPNMVDAHLYRARALAGRLAAAQDRTPASWNEVQRRISAANRIDPDDPEPLLDFYYSFGLSGRAATRNAVDGLILAQTAAPEDRSLRIVTARELLRRREAARARAILSPLASDSHSGALGPKIREVMTTLETGDAAAALVQLDAALGAQRAAPRRGGS